MISLSILTAIEIAFLLSAFGFINGWLMAEVRALNAAQAKKVWYSPAAVETLRQNLTYHPFKYSE